MTKKTPIPDPQRTCETDDCFDGSFERNRYFYGKRMSYEDFLVEQRYSNEKRWLINRSLFGCGVVCGLWVEERGCGMLTLEPGFALDGHGREVIVPARRKLDLAEYLPAGYRGRGRFVLCLRYCETGVHPVRVAVAGKCGGCDEEHVYNHVREGYRLELLQGDAVDAEGCCRPAEGPCPGEVECEQTGRVPSLQEWLCRQTAQGCPDCAEDCIPLAHIALHADGGEVVDVSVKACAGRAVVPNNQLLFRVLRCALDGAPRVIDTSWKEWEVKEWDPNQPEGKVLPWNTFVQAMETWSWVQFDQSMDRDTMTEHTVRMEVLTTERHSGYLVRREVPLVIDRTDPRPDYVRFKPEKSWTDDECYGHSELSGGARVEITLMGGRIRDKRGRGLDGDPIDLPSGNRTQGGDFVSCFRIGPASDQRQRQN